MCDRASKRRNPSKRQTLQDEKGVQVTASTDKYRRSLNAFLV